jgi:DNA replication protein DnaC
MERKLLKVLLNGSELKLRRLSDPEYVEAERMARASGKSLDVCPTCKGREEEIPGSGGEKRFVSRTYRLWGEEYPCHCQGQIALFARYLVANIGEQYMRLNWADYTGSQEVRENVAMYLDKWQDFKVHGMGVEFGGKGLGVGKTFGATHIGKELIKRGQKVFFVPFVEMVSAFEKDNAEELEARMRDTTYLILDELLPPFSDRQHQFYAFRLEALIRHRTNHNLPTIITTNLTVDELLTHYPRTYSLLAAKQLRIDMTGEDARKGRVAEENLELVANGEVRPIT